MFFKVTNSKQMSLHADSFPSLAVQYSTEFFAQPKVGRLFCYDFRGVELEDGITFPEYRCDSYLSELWICECKEPQFVESTYVPTLDHVEEWHESIKKIDRNCWPISNIVFASGIRLVERIDLNRLTALYNEWKKGL